MSSLTIHPIFTFRDYTLGSKGVDEAKWDQYYQGGEKGYGDVSIFIQDLVSPEEIPDKRQRLMEGIRRTILRYTLATPEPKIGDMIDMKPIWIEFRNPLNYLIHIFGEDVIKQIYFRQPLENISTNMDYFNLWESMQNVVENYNKELIYAMSARYDIQKPFEISQTDINTELTRHNLPLSIINLPVEQQVEYRKIFPYAWYISELPQNWVLQNGRNLRYAEEMYPGKDLITGHGSSTLALNRDLKTSWRNTNDDNIRQYKQYMFALDHNEVTPNPLILFRGLSMKSSQIGGEIFEYGFSSKSYAHNIAVDYSKDKGYLLIISYPAAHKFIMVNSGFKVHFLELVSYPGEILRVTNIIGNEIHCDFVGYKSHIDYNKVEITVPRHVEYSILDQSILYAYMEVYTYYSTVKFAHTHSDYKKIIEFLQTTSSVGLHLHIENIQTYVLDDLYRVFQTGKFPLLDSLRAGHPNLSQTIRYLTKNIVTLSPPEAKRFYDKKLKTLEGISKDSATSSKIKDIIYWRAHLTHPIHENDIMEILRIMATTTDVQLNHIPVWRQNYPVISVSTSDIAAVKAELGSMIKAELEPNLIVVQTSPDKIAHLIELELEERGS